MPVRRYTRRTSRRRTTRTGVARLSKYNTYRNRSSAAQASQIYHLARRINRIQSLNKPEIKLYHGNFLDNMLFESGATTTSRVSKLIPDGFVSALDGKFARLNSMTFTMSFRYEDASLVVTSETVQRLPQPVYLRMLFVQTKATRQSGIGVEDLFDESNGLTGTMGPLADGAARVVKILADKKFMINYNHQTVNKVIRFNRLRNYYKATNEQIAKGDVRLFIVGWRPTTITAEDNATNVFLDYNIKIAYTDA